MDINLSFTFGIYVGGTSYGYAGNLTHTSDANPKYAFSIEKYLSTGLKLREDDTYAVYEVDVDEDEMEEYYDEQDFSEAADEAAYP